MWREGKLEAEMEEWQCALAVEGASEAAAAARRVQVGWRRWCRKHGILRAPAAVRGTQPAASSCAELASLRFAHGSTSLLQVGGGGLSDAVQHLAAEPPTWAFAAAAALMLTGRQLTPTLDLLTSQLAVAHGPLALVALGLGLDLAPPQPRQVGPAASFCHAVFFFFQRLLALPCCCRTLLLHAILHARCMLHFACAMHVHACTPTHFLAEQSRPMITKCN